MPLISFEGAEGSGKSTQVNLLDSRLKQAGIRTHVFREPGGTRIGEAIRDLVQHSEENEGIAAETELLLFAASRSQLVHEKIRPALERRQWVICDRFLDSTTVYQGAARQLDHARVADLNSFVVRDCIPDLTFLLDVNLATMQVRLASRELRDRIECEPEKFHKLVIHAYRDLAAREPDRILVIDGTLSVEAIQTRIWDALSTRFPGLTQVNRMAHSK